MKKQKSKEEMGIWTPDEFFEIENINNTQRYILSYVFGFNRQGDQCFASNHFLSQKFKITKRAIRIALSGLKDQGLLKTDIPIKGGRRIITITEKVVQLIWGEVVNFWGGGNKLPPYNIVYISFSKEKESGNSRFRPVFSNSMTKTKKKRRKINLIAKETSQVIAKWNSYSHPFSKIRKQVPVDQVLKPILKKYNPVEITSSLDKAYKYFSDPYFVGSKKLRCVDFFKPNDYGYLNNWMRRNGYKSWFEIFTKKSDEWLDDNLLKTPKDTVGYSDEFYNEVCRILEINPRDRDQQIAIKRIAKRMTTWLAANNTDTQQWPIINDFQYFIRDHYPDVRKTEPHWFCSKRFWNSTFNNYLVDNGRFSHISEIERI